MTDYIASLEAALHAAVAREYPGRDEGVPTLSGNGVPRRTRLTVWRVRSWRVRSRWWRSPLALLLVLLAGGTTAAAIVAVSRSSAPLTGSVPGLAGALRYDVPLTPDLEPGHAGWCSYPIFAITGKIDSAGGGTCSPAVRRGAPVILAGAEPISNERGLSGKAARLLGAREQHLALVWMIVSSQVVSVRIDGDETVASRPDPRLPRNWKAVVAFTAAPVNAMRPVPLDRHGTAIPVRVASSSRVIAGSGGVAPVRAYRPGTRSPAPCSISRVRLGAVSAQWEVVARTIPALGSAVASNTMFSCARSWFSIKGDSQAPSATVLLDAQNPRRPAAPLPGLTPTAQPGVFREPSAEILAERIGPGWLVVQSQSAFIARRLLGAMRVDGSAVGHDLTDPATG